MVEFTPGSRYVQIIFLLFNRQISHIYTFVDYDKVHDKNDQAWNMYILCEKWS